MYNDIGKKIKGLATVVCIIEAIAAFLTGIILIADDDDLIPIGLLVMIGGGLIAWVSSWFVYGFGELIDKVCDIARANSSGSSMSAPQPSYTAHSTPYASQMGNSYATPQSPYATPAQQPQVPVAAPTLSPAERIAQLESLRSQGLITEDEYHQAMAKI